MPPLKGIDRGIDGKMLWALEELGHGNQVVVVDPSYPIPRGSKVVDYHGHSSAMALKGILDLVPHESMDGDEGSTDVVAMDTDDGAPTAVSDEFDDIAEQLGIDLTYEPRNPVDDLGGSKGFYVEASDPSKDTLFVRTRDDLAYACARFIVGHSQE